MNLRFHLLTINLDYIYINLTVTISAATIVVLIDILQVKYLRKKDIN